MLCPSCNAKMITAGERKIDFCKKCKISTVGLEIKKSKMKFKEEHTIKSQEDSVDFVLVASRHLFRAPYSLHEKTAYASIPLTKDEMTTSSQVTLIRLKLLRFVTLCLK